MLCSTIDIITSCLQPSLSPMVLTAEVFNQLKNEKKLVRTVVVD